MDKFSRNFVYHAFLTIQLVFALAFSSCGSYVSRNDRVLTSITLVQRATRDYFEDTSKLPKDLEELKLRVQPEFVKDPWGRDLSFKYVKSKLEIGSYGRDGKLGGGGADSDVFRYFDVYDDVGRIIVGDKDWLTLPALEN